MAEKLRPASDLEVSSSLWSFATSCTCQVLRTDVNGTNQNSCNSTHSRQRGHTTPLEISMEARRSDQKRSYPDALSSGANISLWNIPGKQSLWSM